MLLCQFTHTDTEDNIKNELSNKFYKLTEMEIAESKEVFCDIYCNRGYDSHRCSEEDNKAFIDCDMKNIVDLFKNDDDLEEIPVTHFPCEKCDEMFDTCDKLKKHFEKNHTPDESVKCRLKECGFSTKTIDVLIMHIGVDHLDIVRRKL